MGLCCSVPGTRSRRRAQRNHDLLREVLNGLRWIVRTGSPWRYMPHDLPPWDAGPQPDRGGLLEDKAIAEEGEGQDIGCPLQSHASGYRGGQRGGRPQLLRSLWLRPMASTADMKTALFIFTVGWKVGMLNALLGLGREEIREAGSLGSKGKLGCRSLPGRGGGLFIRTI